MKYPSSIYLRSADDPDALGSSIADSYNLDPDECMANFWHKTRPHHLTIASVPKSERAKYAFALHMLGRVLWNKKHLHCVSVESPAYSFPLWKLKPDHLLEIRDRLFDEIAYESAELCMQIFFEIVSQAHRDGIVDAKTLAKYYAISTDIPEYRTERPEELLRIVRMSLAQCAIQKRNALSNRDALAILMVFLTGLSATEASLLTLRHLTKLADKPKKYSIDIPKGIRHKRVVLLGEKASGFLSRWLGQIYGVSLFCNSTQFPDCRSAHPKLINTIVAKRLGVVVKNVPTLAEFQQNHDLRVLQSFDQGEINLTSRRLLLAKVKLEFDQVLRKDSFNDIDRFYHTFEETLGWWNFPFEKA